REVFLSEPDGNNGAPVPPASDDERNRIGELERELRMTKDYLQSTIEELESANEELQVSNEELQSSNEELQSTNEEMETSREELQSANEELSTVNDELHNRMRDLSEANDDLHNVLRSTRATTVIVGVDQRIRRFTQRAEALLRLSTADIGRPVSYLRSFVPDFDVETILAETIDRMAEREEEALAVDKRWYAIRVAPFKTVDHAIRGAVLGFVDITEDRRRAELAHRINRHATNALSALRGALLVLDADQRVVWASVRYHELFQTADKETIGNLFHNLGNGQWAHPKLRANLARIVAEGTPFSGFTI